MNILDDLNLGFGRKLPLVLQTEAAECGLACLAMVASYHGYRTNLPHLMNKHKQILRISLPCEIHAGHRNTRSENVSSLVNRFIRGI